MTSGLVLLLGAFFAKQGKEANAAENGGMGDP